MKKYTILITLITIITASTNVFSALQNFKLDKKLPKQTVTLTINTKQAKTVWEKAQDHKLRTAAGGFTSIITAIGAAETIRYTFGEEKAAGEEKAKAILGTIILASLSYYLLQPMFSEESNDATQEQNNNQH